MRNLDVIFGWACRLLGGLLAARKSGTVSLASLHPTVEATGLRACLRKSLFSEKQQVFVRAYESLFFLEKHSINTYTYI
jgi:hypothetical protein